VAERYASLMGRISARARTFTHTDMRAVNLFFDEAGRDLTVIDWQLCTYSVPMQDAVYLYASSVTVEDFAEWGVDTMHHYHARLNAHLAEKGHAYSWDDLWHDAQLVSLWALVSPASTVATFEMGNELGARMSDAWVERGFNLPLALGADALLD
jgi:thiamine kinase-like enzyme